MNERLNKCPLCKSGLFLNHTTVKDHMITQEEFLLCKCTKCALVFTNPRPSEEEIQSYYDSKDYISHHDKENNITSLLYKWVRKITVTQKSKLLLKYANAQSNRILDYGCGSGYFLANAKKNKWNTVGIEPNHEARSQAIESGLSVYENLEELNNERKFDVITLFHVLEHVHNLRKTIKSLLKILRKNGVIFIAVPNIQSFDAQQYKENWAAWDAPRHLYHFSQESMHFLIEEFELITIAQVPMFFDSFYVSLLSEKYKSGNKSGFKSLVNSVLMGLKSNNWAKKNNNNYSSILYILKRK